MNDRQLQIVNIIKEQGPITGEKIAVQLAVTRSALRADLSLLSMIGMIEARPKVGYFYVGEVLKLDTLSSIKSMKVSDVFDMPVVSNQNEAVYDVIVRLFIEDSSSVFIADDDGFLCGIVSRKDLLKATIGGNDISKMPISMVMTRVSNIVVVTEETYLLEAAQLLSRREIDSLPVVAYEKGKMKIIGKVSKTLIARLFVEMTQ